MAAIRQPASAFRSHVFAAGQEADLHGRRVRTMAGVESRRQPRLEPARFGSERRPAALGRGSQQSLPRHPRAARARLLEEGFEWIDCCDTENSIIVLMRKATSD